MPMVFLIPTDVKVRWAAALTATIFVNPKIETRFMATKSP
jgi:hypothetical protein